MNTASEKNKKNILLLVSAQHDYVRSVMNKKILSEVGDVTVIESKGKSYIVRLTQVLIQFVFTEKKKFDAVFVSFLAQPLLPVVRIFYKKTVICDAFISLYDTICLDRKTFKGEGIIGSCIRWYELYSLRLADLWVTDTNEHGKFYEDFYGLPRHRFSTVYLGAPPEFCAERPTQRGGHDSLRVFYYGAGNPLQGIDVILKAVRQLSGHPITFTIAGPAWKSYSHLLADLDKEKVTLLPWVPFDALPSLVAKADVCLGGHFGTTAKAGRVIAGKTFQFAAMGKAVILGYNKANLEIFTDNKDSVMVPMGDPSALANAISYLRENPVVRERIARAAWERMQSLPPPKLKLP